MPGLDLSDRNAVCETYGTEGEVDYVGCSAAYLKKLRQLGDGPMFHRLVVRRGMTYRRSDLYVWRSARRFGFITEHPENLD